MVKSRLEEDDLSEGFSVIRADAGVLNQAYSHHELSESAVSLFSQTDMSNSWVALYKWGGAPVNSNCL